MKVLGPVLTCTRCGAVDNLIARTQSTDPSMKAIAGFAVENGWKVTAADRPDDWIASPTAGHGLDKGLCPACVQEWRAAWRETARDKTLPMVAPPAPADEKPQSSSSAVFSGQKTTVARTPRAVVKDIVTPTPNVPPTTVRTQPISAPAVVSRTAPVPVAPKPVAHYSAPVAASKIDNLKVSPLTPPTQTVSVARKSSISEPARTDKIESVQSSCSPQRMVIAETVVRTSPVVSQPVPRAPIATAAYKEKQPTTHSIPSKACVQADVSGFRYTHLKSPTSPTPMAPVAPSVVSSVPIVQKQELVRIHEQLPPPPPAKEFPPPITREEVLELRRKRQSQESLADSLKDKGER